MKQRGLFAAPPGSRFTRRQPSRRRSVTASSGACRPNSAPEQAPAEHQIGQGRIPSLGGCASACARCPEVDGWWSSCSFHNYADHALGKEFREGLAALDRERRVAVMCSEAVGWRCHRRIVADHLIAGRNSVAPYEWRARRPRSSVRRDVGTASRSLYPLDEEAGSSRQCPNGCNSGPQPRLERDSR